MNEVFGMLEKRVFDTLEKSDLEKTRKQLENIKGPTLCTGVGGSYVVSTFATSILERKNSSIVKNIQPRDMLYENIELYNNVLSCSYGGRNYGVKVAFNNHLTKYLLSHDVYGEENVETILYKSSYQVEKSFISLAATLMPMTLLFDYYLQKDISFIHKYFKEQKYTILGNDTYEILSGKDTLSASCFLESTLIEAGIANVIVHDKYDYCHGRTTLSYNNDHSLILFNNETELDKIILSEADKYYKEVIVLNKENDDLIVNDYIQTIRSMYLTKQIAEEKHIDLSKVNYSPFVKKLYYFKGQM